MLKTSTSSAISSSNPVVFKISPASFSNSVSFPPVRSPIITTLADFDHYLEPGLQHQIKNHVEFVFHKNFNICHNCLSFTTLKQSKFERVACLIMSKDSVHTFQKMSSDNVQR